MLRQAKRQIGLRRLDMAMDTYHAINTCADKHVQAQFVLMYLSPFPVDGGGDANSFATARAQARLSTLRNLVRSEATPLTEPFALFTSLQGLTQSAERYFESLLYR